MARQSETQVRNRQEQAQVQDHGVARLGPIETRWELVTPPMAESYLKANTRNRRMIDDLAKRYAMDLKQGQWSITHQGVAFSVSGALVDGQHRLAAIIIAGVPSWLLVTRGLSEDSIEVLDRGAARNLVHVMQIMGHDMASTRYVGIGRAMAIGPQAGTTGRLGTDVSLRKFIGCHAEAITHAATVLRHHDAPASAAAAVARAYYHIAPDTLVRFGMAYRDEIPADELRPNDQPARQLARAVLDARKSHGSGASHRVSIYRKTQRALRASIDGEELKKLHEASDDLFPLPAGTEFVTIDVPTLKAALAHDMAEPGVGDHPPAA